MPGTGYTGKRLRLKRILPGGRTLIVPMDHGVSSGPVAGLEDVRRAVAAVRDGGANAIVVHKGLVDRVSGVLNGGPGRPCPPRLGRHCFQPAAPAAIPRATAAVIFAADAPRAVVR